MSEQSPVSIIRDRGQLTIPSQIRADLGWVGASMPVSIRTESPWRLVVEPHQKQVVNWSKLWENIHLSRQIKNVGKKLSDFVVADRQTH